MGLAAAVALALMGWPQLAASFKDTQRYASARNTEWVAIDLWLDSARCARQTGVLLVVCENGRLVPISDRSLADDPGHALILGVLATISGKDADLVDVARVNLCINAGCLLLLAGMLFCLRLHWAALFFLVVGPPLFLNWVGLSPHWSLVGLTPAQMILPLALVARERGFMTLRMSSVWLLIGIVLLAFAALIREAVATTTLIVFFSVVTWVAFMRWRQRRNNAGLVGLAAMALAAAFSPTAILALRDASHRVDPARHIASHGMSHSLYIGLGSVPNRLGIVYDDDFGYQAALKVDPHVAYQSPEYLRIMRKLYLERVTANPVEVLRIYFVKFKMVAGYWILGYWMLPLWGSLPLLLFAHLAANGGRLSGGGRGADTRLAMIVLSYVFIGFIVLQNVLVMPSQFYSMPCGPLLIVMVGVTMESIAAGLRRALRKEAAQSPNPAGRAA